MSQFLRELLLIHVFEELIRGLFRLAVYAAVAILVVAVLSGRTIAGIHIPHIVDLSQLVGGMLPAIAPEGESQCPDFRDAFPQLLPDSWALSHVQPINIDSDPETECLAIYQYDQGASAFGGLLGGVIYDPQPDRDVTKNLATRTPYRPAAYIPYHLLPREDGKGFLGERSGDWGQIIQVFDANGDTQDEELVIQGFGGYGFPTYLAIFEWAGKNTGYRLMTGEPAGDPIGGTLWGEAGIAVNRETRTDAQGNEIPGPIRDVVAKTRPAKPFWYFRSQFCYARIYTWNEARSFLFQSDYYLTFCFGRPAGAQPRQEQYPVWYPEEALLAWYDDGKVREIDIPARPVGDSLEATVTLHDGTQQRWLATWKLQESSNGQVANMTFWTLKQITPAYDP